MRQAGFLAIVAAAALAGGCGRTGALPSEAELPIGPNRDCGCVRDGQCATIEAAPGWSELRNVSCRWIGSSEVARCSYEERRVDYEQPEGDDPGRGGPIVALSPWRRDEVVARRHRREWCAEQAM